MNNFSPEGQIKLEMLVMLNLMCGLSVGTYMSVGSHSSQVWFSYPLHFIFCLFSSKKIFYLTLFFNLRQFF